MAKESARSVVAQRIGGGVLRTTSPQRSLWEAILPAEALGLPTELTMVDRLLDDPVFIDPFRVHFDPTIGRPSIPIETYLRLMFLKSATGWAMSCCAARSPTRSAGSGSAASPWVAGCPIPPPWSSSPAAWASTRCLP
jgi:hypothetical protein